LQAVDTLRTIIFALLVTLKVFITYLQTIRSLIIVFQVQVPESNVSHTRAITFIALPLHASCFNFAFRSESTDLNILAIIFLTQAQSIKFNLVLKVCFTPFQALIPLTLFLFFIFLSPAIHVTTVIPSLFKGSLSHVQFILLRVKAFVPFLLKFIDFQT